MKSRPFPQESTGKMSLNSLWTKYRKDMISGVGFSIFIYGNKIDENTGEIITANGMLEEFQISIENGVIPIPIGATGFTAYGLWKEVIDNFEEYIGMDQLKYLYEIIGDEDKTSEEIIEATINIINKLK